MSEIIEVTAYRVDELDDEAKAKARDWYRDGAFDYPWYDYVFEDFERIQVHERWQPLRLTPPWRSRVERERGRGGGRSGAFQREP